MESAEWWWLLRPTVVFGRDGIKLGAGESAWAVCGLVVSSTSREHRPFVALLRWLLRPLVACLVGALGRAVRQPARTTSFVASARKHELMVAERVDWAFQPGRQDQLRRSSEVFEVPAAPHVFRTCADREPLQINPRRTWGRVGHRVVGGG